MIVNHAKMNDETVLILSPQDWGHIRVSKHHYAEELALSGAHVFFLNPASEAPVANGISIEKIEGSFAAGSLSVIHWNRRAPRMLRFKMMPLYKQLIKRDIGRIVAAIGPAIKRLWSFEPNTFPDLSAFGAEEVLFMPVDPLSLPMQVNCARNANLVVSISKEILSNFDAPEFQGRTLLVDHGINRAFEEEARRPAAESHDGTTIRAGFFGNLDRPIVNHKMFARLAELNPEIEFHFWGPFAKAGPFCSVLGKYENVFAHGSLNKSDLVEAIRDVDIFLLIYGLDKHLYDRSNAHKILEYLCTGKVIVSSAIARYKNRPDLLRSPESGDDDDIPALFAEVVSQIGVENESAKTAVRKAYALEYSYRSQLDRIERALAEQTYQSKSSGKYA